MTEHTFTADDIVRELASIRDDWLGFFPQTKGPRADRIMVMMLFMLLQQHFKMVASLKGTIWDKEVK